MRGAAFRVRERRERFLFGRLAVVLTLAGCCLFGGEASVSAASSSSMVIGVAPSGGDDAQLLQDALDAASTAGPGAVIELAEGTFRVGRPLIGLNFDGTIRGAGMRKTTVLADGSFNTDGLFELVPPDEATSLHSLSTAILFSFHEGDVDRFGQPVSNRRSQRLVMRDLTLGASGRTVPHFDINVNTDTQRLFSLVWVEGYRPDWTNSDNQTPADIGAIDPEHAEVSTARAAFRTVHFDGRNRARAKHEPGGAFDQNPDVRNAFGIEGGFVLLQPPPSPDFLFRPINAELVIDRSLFTDLPGQAGIFAAELVGKNDPAWTFGLDAVAASVQVTDSIFEDTPSGLLAGDLSDVRVTVDRSRFRRENSGVSLWTNYQATLGGAIDYPAAAPSQVTIRGSTFKDTDEAAVWMDGFHGPPLVDFQVIDNDFRLAGPSQPGVVGTSVEEARIIDNDYSGEGYGGVVAISSAKWRIKDNDFCDLLIPPSASAPPVLDIPDNETEKPIVIIDSVDIGETHNQCA